MTFSPCLISSKTSYILTVTFPSAWTTRRSSAGTWRTVGAFFAAAARAKLGDPQPNPPRDGYVFGRGSQRLGYYSLNKESKFI